MTTGDAPRFLVVDDYEPLARERLAPDVFDYYAGGAGDEWTVERNRLVFDRWMLRPRFLRGAGRPDTSLELLGTRLACPVLVAPWAYQSMAHPEGELATARAAAAAESIMVVSTTAMHRLEELAAAVPDRLWWQLYVFTDRGLTADLLARARDSGYRAICWTVDFVVNGLRHRDTRSGFSMPMGLPESDEEYDPMLSWDDLEWIRSHASGLPILVKGLLTAEDARLAVEHGADGIVVSNHGGRQLDRSPASLDALPEIAEAVDGRIPVLMDGGVRRGTDVLTALALGASAALIGRPAAWGLAAEGEQGVRGVLEILRAEVENAMALSGCRTLEEITRDLVAPVPA